MPSIQVIYAGERLTCDASALGPGGLFCRAVRKVIIYLLLRSLQSNETTASTIKGYQNQLSWVYTNDTTNNDTTILLIPLMGARQQY